MASEADTLEELTEKLAEYNSQLQMIKEGLQENPDDPELLGLLSELNDLIKLVESLMQKKVQEERLKKTPTLATAPVLLTLKYPVGTKVMSKFSEDGEWYEAVIKSVDIDKQLYTVVYTGYGNSEVRSGDDLKDLPEGAEKKRAREEKFEIKEIPDYLLPNPEDTEEERAKKKKKIQSIRMRNKQTQKAEERHVKQASWKNFVTEKTKKKGTKGIITSSIFKSPETLDGKVGVVGSGRGISDIPERKVEHKKAVISLPDQV